jgi:phenylalanine-4-hydroxylase
VTGETDHKLRGDYSRIRSDYTVVQEWGAYSPAQHDLWRRLYARQIALVPKYACDEFNEILTALDFSEGIPRFDAVNAKL